MAIGAGADSQATSESTARIECCMPITFCTVGMNSPGSLVHGTGDRTKPYKAIVELLGVHCFFLVCSWDHSH